MLGLALLLSSGALVATSRRRLAQRLRERARKFLLWFWPLLSKGRPS